jgi:hypothetical protein
MPEAKNGRRIAAALMMFAVLVTCPSWAAQDVSILVNGERRFPIGFYHHPDASADLTEMAGAGVNIVRCGSVSDLDRAHAAGIAGWMPLPLQEGATGALREQVMAAKDHPALAVWEGPDEIVWTFTALSGLYRTQDIHDIKDAWWHQTPKAVAYAESKAATIIPNMQAGAALVRELDGNTRPLWMNEALKSDPKYVRQYLDSFDVIGCDHYPVRAEARAVHTIGVATEHWKRVGRGRLPVWMVLQAFSWSNLEGYHGDTGIAYPGFHESRFMAWDVIARDGRGIFYWGADRLQSDPCRQAIYAVTAELDALQPFLVASEHPGVTVDLVELAEEDIEDPAHPKGKDAPWSHGSIARLPEGNVFAVVRNVGEEWLIVVVNEDAVPHMGVVLSGLDALEGRTLDLLYEEGSETVSHGELMVRMPAYGLRLFATGREWESKRRTGRDYRGE